MIARALLAAVSLLTFLPVRADPPAPREKFHLYILAGQSNMAGRGKPEEQDKTAHARVFVLDKQGQWKPATDPLHFDKPSMAGVGPGLAFGKAMADADPAVTIGLVPCAVGGTSLAKWQPGAADEATRTHPYDDALARIRAARKDGTIRGLVWHQGEADSSDKLASQYGASLEKTLARFRDDLGVADMALVVAELGPFFVEKSPRARIVNQEIMGMPRRLARCGAVLSEGLTDKGDKTHFDTASARELGRRCAATMLKILNQPAPRTLRLWPDGLPDAKPLPDPEKKENARVGKVSDPTITAYLPPREKATGAAIVICPGGGYSHLAIEKEGDCVAQWLNDHGIAGIVLKHRLKEYPQPAPLLDAQRAIRLVRQNGPAWGIDPRRIGIMGFSAGGHLAAAASNSAPLPAPDPRYAKEDAIDCRPDFSILAYGVLPQKGDPWAKGMYTAITLSEKTPPAFLVHAKDDRIPAQVSADYAARCQALGVPVELHLLESGGHGFGLGVSGGPPASWPDQCLRWLAARGFLKG